MGFKDNLKLILSTMVDEVWKDQDSINFTNSKK